MIAELTPFLSSSRHLLPYPLVATLAVLATALLMPAAIRLAEHWRLVDLPNARKVHTRSVPRVGGLVFGSVTLVTIAASAAVWGAIDARVVSLLAAGTLVLAVGVADDLLDLPGKFKLLALLAAAAALCGGGVRLDGLSDVYGNVVVDFGWAGWPVTMLWVVAITVSINFIDGLDGLAGGIGTMAAGVIAVAAASAGASEAALVSTVLAGSLLGFLYYNRYPARVFMGDGGSMLIGFLLAAACLLAVPRTGTVRGLLLPTLALSVPILDTLLTFVRRGVLQRRSIFSAEDGHIHHRLLRLGLRHPHVVLLLYGVSLTAAGVGLVSMLGNGWATLGGLSLLVPLLVGLFRSSGSVRARETVTAVRRNRALQRDARRCRDAFEEAQLRLRKTDSFDGWWTETCAAARRLDFARIDMPLIDRDGVTRDQRWRRSGVTAGQDRTPEEGDHEGQDESPASGPRGVGSDLPRSLRASIPVRQRRCGHGPLELAVEVVPPDVTGRPEDVMESAALRLTLFGRLVGEYNPAAIETRDVQARRMAEATSPARRAVSAHETTVSSDRPAVTPVPFDVDPAEEVSSESLAPPETTTTVRSGAKTSKGASSGVHGLGTDLMSADTTPEGEPRVAIVHDFLYTYAGAERVLEQLLEVYPHADLFSLFDFLPEDERGFIRNKPVTTSFIQRLPFARKRHRAYLPLMPLAVEQLDVSRYDLIVSSSYVAAKGVLTRPDQLHVCYCHSPVRFAWDLQHQYLGEAGLDRGLFGGVKGLLARAILHYVRTWDHRTANGVDLFLANSDFIARRIEKVYRRQAVTVYPPVDLDGFDFCADKQAFYVTASRMVPYKRMDLIVEAFAGMPDKRLVVIGGGPDFDKIEAKAQGHANIKLVGHIPQERLRQYLRNARAFVFAAEEDFGIAPVEAMACGTPVIGFGRGGVAESVIDGKTGVLFAEQTAPAIREAVGRYERLASLDAFSPAAIRGHAERFAAGRFRQEIGDVIAQAWSQWKGPLYPVSRDVAVRPDLADARPETDARPGIDVRPETDPVMSASPPFGSTPASRRSEVERLLERLGPPLTHQPPGSSD